MAAESTPDGSISAFLSSRLARVDAADNCTFAQAEIRNYSDFVDDAIYRRGFADSLFRHTPELLRASRAAIFRINNPFNHKIRCALHVAPSSDKGIFWINGLVKAEGECGSLVQELLSRAIEYMIHAQGNNITFRACYRIFPIGYVGSDGRMRKQNEGSARIFDQFDFKNIGTETVPIQGDVQDSHLFLSAEADGKSFIVQNVESTKLTVLMAKEFILNWSRMEISADE